MKQDLDIIIRPMQISDIPQLLKIAEIMPKPWTTQVFQDCFKPGYFGFVSIPLSPVLRGEGRGEGSHPSILPSYHPTILSFAVILIQLDECQILNICVAASEQGKGLGRKLMQHIMNFAAGHNIQQITLEVRISNQRAIDFYQHLGFKEIGKRRNYYPTTIGFEDAILMKVAF